MITVLNIHGIYKQCNKDVLNDITFEVEAGQTASIECSNELSDMLFALILNLSAPAKGSITIGGIDNSHFTRQYRGKIGVVFRNEGFYDRATVADYMDLYRGLVGSSNDYKEILQRLALLDLAEVKIKHLTYSQKKRLGFAREILKSPKLLLLQDPLLNLHKDDVRIVLESLERLCAEGTAVVSTSISYKDALFIGGSVYHLNQEGITSIEKDKGPAAKALDYPTKSSFNVSKIPAKLEDRILLFDPVEIDYVESEQSLSYLHVRGEKFSSTMPLNELEERLRFFGFFRCHRSYLVNLQRVREVITWTRNSYSLSLDDKHKSSIPLAKGRLDELKEILSL